jgi:hypothetical protein
MKLGSKITVGVVCGLAMAFALSFDRAASGDDAATIGACAFSAAVGADEEHEFVGNKSCKKCHIKVFKSWEKLPHGMALNVLKPGERAESKARFKLDPQKDYTQDESCIGCHTVGFGKPGGYVIAKAEDADAVKKSEQLAHVGCESCHGPGKDYIEVFNDIQKSKRKYTQSELTAAGLNVPDEATCLGCHNEKSPTHDPDKKFDYAEALKTGIHEHETLELREQ